MIYGSTEYGTISPILQAKLNIDQGHHTPKKSDSVFETIKHDHNITIFHVGQRVLKGACIGFGLGFISYFFKKVDRKVLTNRIYSVQLWREFLLRRTRINVALGALCGAAWYFIHDIILCPHGQTTQARHVLSYSIAGAALWALFWNPASFFYGAIWGTLTGLKSDVNYNKIMPKDLEIEFGKVDPEARERAVHDQNEYQLSLQLAKSKKSLIFNSYAL